MKAFLAFEGKKKRNLGINSAKGYPGEVNQTYSGWEMRLVEAAREVARAGVVACSVQSVCDPRVDRLCQPLTTMFRPQCAFL